MGRLFSEGPNGECIINPEAIERERKYNKELEARILRTKLGHKPEPLKDVRCKHCRNKINMQEQGTEDLTCPRCGIPYGLEVKVITGAIRFVDGVPPLASKKTKEGNVIHRAITLNGRGQKWSGLQLFLSEDRRLFTVAGVK